MVVIGLTGNLGAGKTTVARMFEHFGAKIVDADAIAHDLLTNGGPCRRSILKKFPDAVAMDGSLDRSRIAKEVFQNPKKLRILEDILHPAVGRRIQHILKKYSGQKKSTVVVLDIPLLFETGLETLADVAIVVRANRLQQIGRVVKARGMTRADAEARLRRQMPQDEKLKRADFVIDNRFSKAKTRTQVKRIWEGLVNV